MLSMDNFTSVIYHEELKHLNEKATRIVNILETTDPVLLDRIVNQHEHSLIHDDLIRWVEDKEAFIIPYLGRFNRVTGEESHTLYETADSAKRSLLEFILRIL